MIVSVSIISLLTNSNYAQGGTTILLILFIIIMIVQLPLLIITAVRAPGDQVYKSWYDMMSLESLHAPRFTNHDMI